MNLRHSRPRAFSMVELMAVLAIIVILITILVPTVSKVRRAGQETSVKAQVASLDAAIQRYQQDFGAYPGPLPRNVLYDPTSPPVTNVFDVTGGTAITNISGSENLTLGLLGGLKPRTAGGGFDFDAKIVGGGPRRLNPSNPGASKAYIENLTLSDGDYKDGAGDADDSVIPEILDKFPNAMPILYLRAQVGAGGVVSYLGNDAATGGAVIPGPGPTQYDIREILGYTNSFNGGSIGEGKTIKRSDYVNVNTSPSELPHGIKSVTSTKTFDKGAGTNYSYPYDAFPYFQNRAIPPTSSNQSDINRTGTPRMKDKYILISAGSDRVYGTADDITNFGSVLE